MGIIGAILIGFVILAAIRELVPLIFRIFDAILLAIIRIPLRILMALAKAPFRLIAHRIRSRSQLSPYARSLRRATEGAFLAAASIYAASWFPAFLKGQSVFDLIAAFARSPLDFPAVAIWAVAAALGLIWLCAGIKGARATGDRDLMVAFWSAVIAGSASALLWWHWFPEPEPATMLETAALKTAYTAIAAAGLVRLSLSMPRLSNAINIVGRHIRDQAVVWRSARGP
jgi:hypothetical protein